MSVGTVFTRCPTCRTLTEDEENCPTCQGAVAPVKAKLPAPLPRMEVVGEHTYLNGEDVCSDCGCPIEAATARRCGTV